MIIPFSPAGYTRKQKQILLTYLLAALTILLIAIYIEFHPSSSFFVFCMYSSAALTPLILFLLHKYPATTQHQRSLLIRVTILLFVVIGVFALLVMVQIKVIGKIENSISGKYIHYKAIIDEKSSGQYRRRECDHSITLKYESEYMDTKYCLPQNQWSILNVGDQIDVMAKSSRLGYVIDSVAKISSEQVGYKIEQ